MIVEGEQRLDQERTRMVMANHTAPKYSSVVDHDTMTFYQIKIGILISQILWLEAVPQICSRDIFVRVTSVYQVLMPTSEFCVCYAF